MKRRFTHADFDYYLVMLFTYTLLFGGIILSGLLTGIHWTDYSIDVSWSMLNTEELKRIFWNR
ncbi:hypothetical protein SAMN04487936_103267 [Halobacillus dabanensis]|uniref:Uncharacterized protein n=1 Tax=Halobacillus dabanensis TaxID=240302 RepID=A0A1I3T9F7_HALDA|nr:hypothetical protein [Halobacillus dabanensis]SFJ66969.1 hypothetical protein SAMN04487936_103267 [Halobacillus dabanensis]